MLCKICNLDIKTFRGLMVHTITKHNIKSKEYYDKFIKIEDEGICKYKDCKNTTTYVNVNQGYLRYCCTRHSNCSEENKKKIRKTKQLKYGNENYINVKKIKEVKLLKYGDEKYNNKEKWKESNLNRSNEEKNNSIIKFKLSWSKKNEKERMSIYNKRKNTIIKKYGKYQTVLDYVKNKYNVENIMNLEEAVKKCLDTWNLKSDEELEKIKKKRKNTQVKNGKCIPNELCSEFIQYKRQVDKFTLQSLKLFKKEVLLKRGLCGKASALQIDHIFSIRDGFVNNILPQIIGNFSNLQIISWEINVKKQGKSWFTKEQLFNVYSIFKTFENINIITKIKNLLIGKK